ncbi:MAG: TIGR04282 family arsenosugar biosynthesis glycosyltransferase [Candidatus Omnitrophota bacterium]
MPQDTLIIFMKYPRPGRVKTRLAADIGRENAAHLYRLFAEAILQTTQSGNFRRIVYYAPRGKKQDFQNWLGKETKLRPQQGQTLGQRLSDGFKSLFWQGAKRVVAIGTDSPLLSPETINRAFRLLRRHQCVLGPCIDGGYYLLGLSGFYPAIFQKISWGTNKVLRQTLKRIEEAKLSHKLLNPGFDIDDIGGLLLLEKMLMQTQRASARFAR